MRLRRLISTNAETSEISCHDIFVWIVSWPLIASTIACTQRFQDTRRLFRLGPGSVFSLAWPKPTAFASLSAWHWPQYLR